MSWWPWYQDIYRAPGELYMRRYYLLGGPRYGKRFNVYLHCFHSSDLPVPHNHPWTWAKSLILRGSYIEYRKERSIVGAVSRKRVYRPGMINHISGDTYHYVTLTTPRVWTLFVSWKRMQDWGFMTRKGFVPHKEYVSQ